MDADRFDTLAKRLAAPTSRRTALGGAVTGGLLGALGFGRAEPERAAAQGGLCVLDFVATVRQGPARVSRSSPAARRASCGATWAFL